MRTAYAPPICTIFSNLILNFSIISSSLNYIYSFFEFVSSLIISSLILVLSGLVASANAFSTTIKSPSFKFLVAKTPRP